MIKKFKSKYGKYFTFKDTINGWSYLLRGLAVILFAIPLGLFVGGGLGLLSLGKAVFGSILIFIGVLFLIPMIWFSLATTYKRIYAFFPNRAVLLLVLSIIYSLFIEFFSPGDTAVLKEYTTYLIVGLPYWIWSFYLLFGNSKIEKHIG